MGTPSTQRRYPIGAELKPSLGVHFRVWAPNSRHAAVEFETGQPVAGTSVQLDAEPGGYFSGLAPGVRAGARYKIRLDHGLFPDPASRLQPDGPHGPSEVVDPDYPWSDRSWKGRPAEELVVYEMHLGTFTPEGTWESAARQLPELARLGITAVEVMPIAEFGGRFGWGYDGVDLFAPSRLYGAPSEAKAFIDRAHAEGVMVILDVVYNHMGPEGNYLPQFSKSYLAKAKKSEWGDTLNFDEEQSESVREFFVTNARYWIEEYHFDGLRLDATQQIFDRSDPHILAEISKAAREAAPGRRIHLVAENEHQDTRLLRPADAGGHGLDAIWNDDFHHSAWVAATGRSEAYYIDYRGKAQEFVSAVKHGFLYQGQWCRWQGKRRGTPAFGLSPHRFVVFLQNHDQVSNSMRGARIHEVTSPGTLRALTALTLLAPSIPLLFQGQEFAASAPFVYFADHPGELAKAVIQGRRDFLSQFRTVAAEPAEAIPDPSDPETFRRCKLDFSERARHAPTYRLHADLLRIRREDASIARPERLDGAVLSDRAFVLRYFSESGDDRLVLVNLGDDLYFNPAPEPLLAPPEGRRWAIAWSSESPDYGGFGTPPVETAENWIILGHAAFVLKPDEPGELPKPKLSEKD